MKAEPLFIVGAGRVGSALAALWLRSGIAVSGLWTQSAAGAKRASVLCGCPTYHGALPDAVTRARTVVIAVRDSAVSAAAGALLDGGLLRCADQVLHCGGARPARDALGPLAGYRPVATLHPLIAIADPVQALRLLPGAFFGVEGDATAADAARELVAAFGGRWFQLEPEAMALYHAAAVMASNHAIALWDAARWLMVRAGLPDQTAAEALLALCRSTLENAEQAGFAGALTGPVRRGDAATVARHLDELADESADLRALYLEASRATLATAHRASAGKGDANDLLAEVARLLRRDDGGE